MRTLLIAPPMQRFMGFKKYLAPLGLMYLAGQWPDCWVYDADYNPDGSSMAFGEKVESYSEYLVAQNDPNHAIWQEVRATIAKASPEVVGVQVLSGLLPSARMVARIAREEGACKVIAGGPHATLAPADLEGEFNVVVRGEAESLQPSHLSGIVTMPRMASLDGLKVARNRMVYPERYHPDDLAIVMTSRGCPNACSFCSSSSLWGRHVVFRSVGDVLAEVDGLISNYHPSTIAFWDDTFTYQRERLEKICEGLRQRRARWNALVRCDTITEDIARMMRACGCEMVRVGLETGSESILATMNKRESMADMREAREGMHRAGLPFLGYFMVGSPGETKRDVEATIRFLREVAPTWASLSVYSPYPGTEWAKGEKADYWRYNHHCADSYTGMPREWIRDAFAAVDEYNRGAGPFLGAVRCK